MNVQRLLQTLSFALFVSSGLCFQSHPSSRSYHHRGAILVGRSYEQTRRSLMPEAVDMIGSAAETSSNTLAALVQTSPEPIHSAFAVATFLPQPFWVLLTLVPNTKITKKIMGGLEVPILCCLVHFTIVAGSIILGGAGATAPMAEFNDVFDPAADNQAAFIQMLRFPNFVAEEWSHVLTWDLFVGRYIWLDGLRRDIFTVHSVLFANLIGPPGLLLHWLTCTLYGKPLVEPSEKEDIMELGN